MSKIQNPHLRIAQPLAEIEGKAKRYRRAKYKRRLTVFVLLALMLGGTYLLLSNRMYTNVRTIKSYSKETADSNQYMQFSNGIVRYSRDGVVFLNRKNEEKWIQSCQIQNPIIAASEKSFAIADSGGNSILVFDRNGLKGEMETTLPIEKITVSNQGIVSAILKNEKLPKVISYDAAGNILVEHQITLSGTGYPVSLAMSSDGNLLAVSYLYTDNGTLTTRVIYYNFGSEGQENADNQVTLNEYADLIVPELFFMDASTSVAVGDNAFYIYKGSQVPEMKKEVKLDKEIKSAFHSAEHIGFVLKKKGETGYELRLYNAAGRQVLSRDFTGEYGSIKMEDGEVIMYEGSKVCIYTVNGLQRFKGDVGIDVLEIVSDKSVNKYLMISANELRVVRLAK